MGNQKTITTLKGMILRNDLPYVILFWGPPGIGKTSAAVAFAREYFRYYGVYDQAGNFEEGFCRGFDPLVFCDSAIRVQDVEGRIRELFRNMPPLSDNGIMLRKILVFDEADKTSREALLMLRSYLEKYSGNNLAIMTSNEDPERWLNPRDVSLRGVASRVRIFKFEPPEKSKVCELLKHIAEKEKIKVTEEELDKIIENATVYDDLDIRKAIDELESLSSYKAGLEFDEKVRGA